MSKDRLTKRINGKVFYTKGQYAPTTLCAEMETWDIRECMEKLSHYEDLDEQLGVQTNFDRVTRDKKSLIDFVMYEVLDLNGPHMDHNIGQFKSQHKFNEWLNEECRGNSDSSSYCDYCLNIRSSTPASPRRKYIYCPMCGIKLDLNIERNFSDE